MYCYQLILKLLFFVCVFLSRQYSYGGVGKNEAGKGGVCSNIKLDSISQYYIDINTWLYDEIYFIEFDELTASQGTLQLRGKKFHIKSAKLIDPNFTCKFPIQLEFVFEPGNKYFLFLKKKSDKLEVVHAVDFKRLKEAAMMAVNRRYHHLLTLDKSICSEELSFLLRIQRDFYKGFLLDDSMWVNAVQTLKRKYLKDKAKLKIFLGDHLYKIFITRLDESIEAGIPLRDTKLIFSGCR